MPTLAYEGNIDEFKPTISLHECPSFKIDRGRTLFSSNERTTPSRTDFQTYLYPLLYICKYSQRYQPLLRYQGGSARSIPDEEETKNDWYLCRERLPRYLILTSDDRPRRHVLLQLNRESASDGLHDTRGPALLAQFRVPVVVMRVPHVLRGNFIFEKGSFGHEHSGRLYAADELVPGENNRVFVHGRLTDAGQMWVHVDLHVRGCKI